LSTVIHVLYNPRNSAKSDEFVVASVGGGAGFVMVNTDDDADSRTHCV